MFVKVFSMLGGLLSRSFGRALLYLLSFVVDCSGYSHFGVGVFCYNNIHLSLHNSFCDYIVGNTS